MPTPCDQSIVSGILKVVQAQPVANDKTGNQTMNAAALKQIALQCGFDLAGIAPAGPMLEADHYLDWARRGMAGKMGYLTDHRADKRRDPRTLLASARTVLVVGQLYNSPAPYSTELDDATLGWISRYAWGDDYHAVMRARLENVDRQLRQLTNCETKICIDTAPLLERPLARAAGLGWIGKNTCLINQQQGSWFFLGELLTSLELETGAPPPDRCGSCTRCIDACPTAAIVPTGHHSPAWELDARLCISYLNIELKGEIPEEQRPGLGHHIFGCDICQDVCPFNGRAPTAIDAFLQPRFESLDADTVANWTLDEYHTTTRRTALRRVKLPLFQRNARIVLENQS